MNDESAYRIVLGLAVVAVIPIAAWHRARAHTGEPLDRRQEGLPLAIALRVLGAAHMLSVLVYLVRPAWIGWASVPLPAALRWSGAALGAGAALLITWALHHLGRNLTDTVVTRERATLVTTGPYRWIRHPFYSGTLLAVLANSILAANAFLFATGAGVFLLMVLRTPVEEANLVARFGDDYRSYMERTARFFPRMRRRHRQSR